MLLSTPLPTRAYQVAVWLTQHPHVTRVMSIALPFVVALIVALVTGLPAYAGECPVNSSCGSGG